MAPAPVFFSFEMDEVLLAAVKSKSGMTTRKWDRIAESFENVTGADCRERWDVLQGRAGVEYRAFLLDAPPVHPPAAASASAPGRIAGPDPVAVDPAPKPTPPPAKRDDDDLEITIHVRDEGRQISRDFTCPKRTLLSGMSYFRHYLNDSTASDDIDISVHCDVHIFDWLMRYVKKQEPLPELGPKTIVSILISSEFLKMDALVDESVTYFTKHLQEIVRVPIDLSCVSTPIVAKVASQITIQDLHRLDDPKDKIAGQLYKHKLEQMLSEPGNEISLCQCCGILFTRRQFDEQVCTKANLFIDFHGRIVARHSTDPQTPWSLSACLTSLRADGTSWCDLFWMLWGVVTDLYCTKCATRFRISDLGHCSFHPCDPVFLDGATHGRYLCCKAQVLRFDTLERPRGCRAANHIVDSSNEDRHKLEILLDRRATIMCPFLADGEVPRLSRLGLPTSSLAPSRIASRAGHQHRLQDMSVSVPPTQATGRNAHPEARAAQAAVPFEIERDQDRIDAAALSDNSSDDDDESLEVLGSDSDSDAAPDSRTKDAPARLPPSVMKKTTISFGRGGRASKRGRRSSMSNAPSSKSSLFSSNPAKHRLWKLDSLRDDDRQRMHSLVHRLKGMRKDDLEGSSAAAPSLEPSLKPSGKSGRSSKAKRS